jgi:hypothetical protein
VVVNDDKNPKPKIDTQVTKEETPGFIRKFITKIKASFFYEPNLSFIGMNHAINL